MQRRIRIITLALAVLALALVMAGWGWHKPGGSAPPATTKPAGWGWHHYGDRLAVGGFIWTQTEGSE